jgi:endogenous inhibitor of DNA gyrase (YacG/DUF329 family)
MPTMFSYQCRSCGKRWRQEHYFNPESCAYCQSLDTEILHAKVWLKDAEIVKVQQ